METLLQSLGIGHPTELFTFVVWGAIFLILVYKFVAAIRVVPTKSAYVVERLGRYSKTLGPGFHALIPFLDKVAYIQDLKEQAIDVPPQECFTKDEVNVEVDGVMYISVLDPVKASYGITDYAEAAMQLAQTTTRSVIGTLELDKTFEERSLISSRVVEVLSRAGQVWGIQVHRYEIKNITPPETVHKAMEKQVTAERERRALIAEAEGVRQSKINRSEGHKVETINRSEGEMQSMINEAEGQAQQILAIAEATAQSIAKIAAVVREEGGDAAVHLQLSGKHLEKLKLLAREDARVVLPADLTDADGLFRSIRVSDAPTRAD